MLVTPTILKGDNTERKELPVQKANVEVVREGMRLAVVGGTASGLNMLNLSVAAKTGTAEVGSKKQFVHSWATGFFPYERPRYAFAVVMESSPASNLVGGVFVMRELLLWMEAHRPEYLYRL
jgi:cell division protein FtsI/penicillin-binding protein 2